MTLKTKLRLGGCCFLLFIAGVFYVNSEHDFIVSQRAMTEVAEGGRQGETAAPFSLKNAAGELIHLEDYSGKKVLLFFFTSWCEICSEQWLTLEAAAKNGLLDNVEVVALNLTKEERNSDDVRRYLQSLPLAKAEVLLDEAGDVQKMYQVIGVPTILLLNPSQLIEARGHFLTLENMRESRFFTE
ncbi:AhpC/TSA family protein [Evansella caseinilytica]|uniref:AhpC/TSA family protein n=1 Tax=Evansella caseinilytica TaxID=1503961 RepID=A0A1H3PI08_9BACI|nr:TlpA disulfide reductase family protein [Evansella caseinilytica]SDZ00792.1 AhpC/TSA family protein [Evansella caseinilytica]